MLLPLVQALGISWVLLLPGLLVVQTVRAPWSPGVRALIGASLGMLAMPMLCFCAAWLVRSSVTPELSVAVAALVNLPAGAVILAQRRRDAARERHG